MKDDSLRCESSFNWARQPQLRENLDFLRWYGAAQKSVLDHLATMRDGRRTV